MKNACLFGIIFLLQSNILFAQQKDSFPFKVEGIINVDTGTVELDILSYYPGYYPQKHSKMLAKVVNGNFTFSGFMPYPQAYIISYENSYQSHLFVLEPGNQTIVCNVEAFREVPQVNNKSMLEYTEDNKISRAYLDKKRGIYDFKRDSLNVLYQNELPVKVQLELEKEIKALYKESDSVRLAFVSAHPDSYAAFWSFIGLFAGFGYESIFDQIYEAFSDSLKSTHTGIYLAKQLGLASAVDYGKVFPPVRAVDSENKELDYTTFLNNRYTFVDFWYSNCSPCIAQFPHLKETYNRYKDKGFEVVGISTDKLSYEENWLKAIQKYQLDWPQYWDKDGIESKKISINKFPTNFLLNERGEIIKKDLRPVELEQFLKENI